MTQTKNSILFLPWKELKRLQEKKLHYFLTRQLYPFSNYYRRLFDKHKINPNKIRTIENLKDIPFTSKEDFLDSNNLDFILQPNKELISRYLSKIDLAKIFLRNMLNRRGSLKNHFELEYNPIFLTATAGTTNQPVSFVYTSYDLENLKVSGRRVIEILGAKHTERGVNVFPYAPHLAFWQTFFAGFAANTFILSTGGGKTLGTEGNIRSILKVKPQFLIGVPSYIYHLLKALHQQNANLSFLRLVILGAAAIPSGFKEKLLVLLKEMGALDVKIFGTYGFTEARCAWVECPSSIEAPSGYHSYPDKGIFEVVDPDTGQVKEEGQDGELVYTNIDGRGSCVLRYRTGDLAKGGIVYSPCPYCGRTVPRISSIITRASNIKNLQFSKIKGTLVNLNVIERLLDDKKEIDEWQIEIAKKDNDPFEVDELNLYIHLLTEADKESFCAKLNEEIFSNTEVSFNKILVVSQKEIQERIEIESAVKAKRIVDRRKLWGGLQL